MTEKEKICFAYRSPATDIRKYLSSGFVVNTRVLFLLKKKVVAFQNTNTRLDTGNNIFKESTFQVETVECI